MPVIVKLNYLRIAPRKVRLAANLIRKKKVDEAEAILNFANKKGVEPLLKLLKTAVADARHNFQLEPNNLYISKITVDKGPKYKRWRPRARGAAYEIQKKTSHITLVLDEIAPGKKAKKIKKPKKAKEIKKPLAITKKRKVSEEIKKEETPESEKPKFKARPEAERPKPKTERGIKRFFRRKSFRKIKIK